MHLFTLFGVLLIVIVAFGFYLIHPIQQGLATSKTMQDAATAYEQHPVDPTMRILVAGDSTAVGTGALDSVDSVAGRLGTRYPDADIENVSENGLRLEGLVRKLEPLEGNQYNLIVIQIGANDVIGLTPLSKIRDNLRSVLEYAEAHSTDVIVLTSGNIGLAPVFRQPLASLVSWRTREVRALFMEEIESRDRVQYIDLYKEAKDETFNTDTDRYYAVDRFHPSGEGYGLWFNEIEKALP